MLAIVQARIDNLMNEELPKIGDLVVVAGGMWSSYAAEGNFGLLVEICKEEQKQSGYLKHLPERPWCRVQLCDTGSDTLVLLDHIEVLCAA